MSRSYRFYFIKFCYAPTVGLLTSADCLELITGGNSGDSGGTVCSLES